MKATEAEWKVPWKNRINIYRNFFPLRHFSIWILFLFDWISAEPPFRLTEPLNHFLGRRGTIFVTCVISSATCVWQAFASSWWHLFIARFVLGWSLFLTCLRYDRAQKSSLPRSHRWPPSNSYRYRDWAEKRYYPNLCCRMCPSKYTWRVRYFYSFRESFLDWNCDTVLLSKHLLIYCLGLWWCGRPGLPLDWWWVTCPGSSFGRSSMEILQYVMALNQRRCCWAFVV